MREGEGGGVVFVSRTRAGHLGEGGREKGREACRRIRLPRAKTRGEEKIEEEPREGGIPTAYLVRVKNDAKALDPCVRAMRELKLVLIGLACHPLPEGWSRGFVAFSAGAVQHHDDA